MRILIISTFFPPENSIAANRPYSWAKYWSRAGHDVTVLTLDTGAEPSQLFPTDGFQVVAVAPRPWISWLKQQYGQQTIGGGSEPRGVFSKILRWPKKCICRAFDRCRRRYGIFSSLRMPDFADFWIRPALKKARSMGTWDLVVSTAGPYAVHIVAHQLKTRGLAKKWVADYRDLWVDQWLGFSGLFPFTLVEQWLERRLLRAVDVVSTVSEPLADYFRARYPRVKLSVVENGFDPGLLQHIPSHHAFPDDGKVRIVYLGSLYEKAQDPSPLFEAIWQLNANASQNSLLDKLEVLFIGPRLGNVDQLISHHRVDPWVLVKKTVPREVSLQMQRDAHALLYLPWTDVRSRGIVPAKLFEYMYSKTPILAIGLSIMETSQQFILEANAGRTFGRDVVAIKNYLIDILKTGKKTIVQTNQSFIDQFRREVLAEKFLRNLQQFPITTKAQRTLRKNEKNEKF